MLFDYAASPRFPAFLTFINNLTQTQMVFVVTSAAQTQEARTAKHGAVI